MKLIRLIMFAVLGAVVAASAGVAKADGGDGHVTMGGGGPGSPTCTQFQGVTGPDGSISSDCTVAPGTIATTIGFATPDIFTNGGLSCASNLTNIGWTESQTTLTIGGVLIDVCSFTAPTTFTWSSYLYAISQDNWNPLINDGDCDLDDFLLGIPGANVNGNGSLGCDITFSTNANGTQLFSGSGQYDVTPTIPNVDSLAAFSVPEPGSLSLLMMGLAGLPFFRRKSTR